MEIKGAKILTKEPSTFEVTKIVLEEVRVSFGELANLCASLKDSVRFL